MRANDLYPRWYFAMGGFVWGCFLGLAGATLAYETKFWQPGGFWSYPWCPLLLSWVPIFVLSLFEIFFRVRRYLRPPRHADGSLQA